MKRNFPVLKQAGGHGFPPSYVADISFEKFQITIQDGSETNSICCDSEESLEAMCFKLASERVPFTVGGMSGGPAADMAFFQETGKLKTSFLSISWTGQKVWTAKEIVPHTRRWKITDLDDLLGAEPIDIADLGKPNLLQKAMEEFKSLFGVFWKSY